MPTLNSKTVAVSIDRPWREVYAFAADPANLPQWAAGLGEGFEHSGQDWIFRTPGGEPARMRFAAPNDLGVLDHDVFPEGQPPVHVALRVMPNGDGAEVTFLLLQAPGMSEEDFARDEAAVRADLAQLKTILER